MTARENTLAMIGVWIGLTVAGSLVLAHIGAWTERVRAWYRWRSIQRRASPEPWPYDWRVSCPELRQPVHLHVRRR